MLHGSRPSHQNFGFDVHTVLCIGKEPILLQTRTQVLRSAGFAAISSSELGSGLGQFATEDFDAVVLCHTLSAAERRAVFEFVRFYSPSTAIVQVFPTDRDRSPYADRTVSSDPQSLISQLGKLRTEGTKSRLTSGP
jgi:hypothetical protein